MRILMKERQGATKKIRKRSRISPTSRPNVKRDVKNHTHQQKQQQYHNSEHYAV